MYSHFLGCELIFYCGVILYFLENPWQKSFSLIPGGGGAYSILVSFSHISLLWDSCLPTRPRIHFPKFASLVDFHACPAHTPYDPQLFFFLKYFPCSGAEQLCSILDKSFLCSPQADEQKGFKNPDKWTKSLGRWDVTNISNNRYPCVSGRLGFQQGWGSWVLEAERLDLFIYFFVSLSIWHGKVGQKMALGWHQSPELAFSGALCASWRSSARGPRVPASSRDWG